MSESDLGFTDEQRKRIAAAANADDDWGMRRALDGKPVDGDGDEGAADALADHLRDRLGPGEKLVASAHRIGTRVDRSGSSVANSLGGLARRDPDGLRVEYRETSGRPGQWVIERFDAEERGSA